MFNEVQKKEVQRDLRESPERGPVIRDTGGVRKMRVGIEGRGKRGGARVCYYYRKHVQTVYLLDAYDKRQKDDLTSSDKRALKELVNRIKRADVG